MDELLVTSPTPLNNERKEMYCFFDRFSASICNYHEQYNALANQKHNELQQRKMDAAGNLKKLQDKYNSEFAAMSKKHQNVLIQCESRLTAVKSQASSDIQKEERALVSKEKEERLALDRQNEMDTNTLQAYRNTCDKVDYVFAQIDLLLGKTIRGNSKRDIICDNQDFKTTVSTIQEATSILSMSAFSRAEDLFARIKKIQESLPQKIFFKGKRNRLIGEIAELRALTFDALSLMEGAINAKQISSRTNYENKCRNLRIESDKRKNVIIARRDSEIKKLNNKLNQLKKLFADESDKKKNEMIASISTQKDEYSRQILDAEKKWDISLAACSKSFISKMEEIYPSQQLYAWMKQFWRHPRAVEDYPTFNEPQLNVLIGVALIDISEWFKGEPGAIVSQLLNKRYPYLLNEKKLYLPYSISIEEGTSVLLSHPDELEERVKNMINAFAMRMFRSVPACMMRFLLIDANGIGTFGRLMALDPAQLNNTPGEPPVKSLALGEGSGIYSDPTSITNQISETKITMDALSQQLSNYKSIREFNELNPLSKQIYRPMLMTNFPLGIDIDSIRKLNAMITGCNKWGFSAILAQPDKYINSVKPEDKIIIDELNSKILCLRVGSKDLTVMNSNSSIEKRSIIYIYPLPDKNKVTMIMEKIRRESVIASRILIEFEKAKGICPQMEKRFIEQSDDGIIVPVGYLEGGQTFNLVFNDTYVNTVIYGNIGSGKTNLLHVLLTNLMLRYSQDEVKVYLIDFKHGLDFRIYTQYNLPNFQTISINDDPEFALAMLEYLDKEQEIRSQKMGSNYHKLSEYNADNPDRRMCRILLIIDELYELVKQANDDIQKRIIRMLDHFVHLTRAFGIHTVISGQDLNKIPSFDTIKSQCNTRIAMHCTDEQVRDILDESGVARMHTIDASDKGACVFSLSGGHNPQIEHTVYLSIKQQERLLQEIGQHYNGLKQYTTAKVLLTNVKNDKNNIFQRFVDRGDIVSVENELFVGEPISMEYTLNFKPSGNIWIAGGVNNIKAIKAANSTLLFLTLSLLLEKLRNDKLDIICTNCCDIPIRNIEEAENDRFGQLSSSFPQLFQYTTSKQFKEVLNSELAILDSRKNGDMGNDIWWIISRPEIMDELSDHVIIDFRELLVEGPKNGIHVVVWTGDVKKALQLQFQQKFFEDRVCLEMSTEEIKIVLGSDVKEAPSAFKALYTGKTTMRFRVYDLPDSTWMESLFKQLSNKC